MMAKQQRLSPPVVGGSSLLVIFVVLCLTVFALLSLNTVMTNQRLNQASIAAVSEYYAADCKAEEIFARLRQEEMPEGVTEKDGVYYYSCPISKHQILQVEVTETDEGWQILRWQVVAAAEWEEHTPTFWDGEL